VTKHAIPYRFIRKKVSPRLLPEPVRVNIAQYTDLDTLIWYYEGSSQLNSISHPRPRRDANALWSCACN
jgi:hypothetical protein